MFDILLIGFGIAGKLHNKVFLRENFHVKEILVHDPFIEIDNIVEINFIKNLYQIKNNRNEVILDICTTSDTHIEWIEFAIENDFKYVIIEKPLVTTHDDLSKLKNLLKSKKKSFSVNYNYLCSPTLFNIIKVIEEYQFKIIKIKTNFSKNRVNDSKLKRGANKHGELLHNFLIEIPHQLSLAIKLLGEIKEIETCYSKDMVLDNQIIKNHGEGFISLTHKNGILSEHYSNLMDKHTIREIIIETEDKYTLTGNFGIQPEYFGKVELTREGIIIYSNTFQDKSLDSFLSQALHYFENQTSNPCNIDFACDINHIILDCIDRTNLSI